MKLWISSKLGSGINTKIVPSGRQKPLKRGQMSSTPRGLKYLQIENIRQRLAMRNFYEEMRNAARLPGGPAPFGRRRPQKFGRQLDRWLQRNR